MDKKVNTHKVIKNRETGEFELIELSTNYVLKRDVDHDNVHRYYKFVKNGGAFAGNTPGFMMIDLSTAKRKPLEV
jgi:hypothetical protein